MNYALSDCERYESNTQGDCGGRVEEVRLPGKGDVILCENCRNKPRLNWCDECGCGTGHSSDCSKKDKTTSSPAAKFVTVEVFRVTRSDKVGTEEVAVEKDESVLFGFVAPNGERVGIQLNTDGGLTIGGWDADGEWIELVPQQVTTFGHTVTFPLDQYED